LHLSSEHCLDRALGLVAYHHRGMGFVETIIEHEAASAVTPTSGLYPQPQKPSNGRRVRRLPNRRASENFEINVNGRRYRCSFSQFPDGRWREDEEYQPLTQTSLLDTHFAMGRGVTSRTAGKGLAVQSWGQW
jgi:hypothetical protein